MTSICKCGCPELYHHPWCSRCEYKKKPKKCEKFQSQETNLSASNFEDVKQGSLDTAKAPKDKTPDTNIKKDAIYPRLLCCHCKNNYRQICSECLSQEGIRLIKETKAQTLADVGKMMYEHYSKYGMNYFVDLQKKIKELQGMEDE